MQEKLLRMPTARSRNLFLVCVRLLWTLPTNIFGYLAGWLFTWRVPRIIGGAAARACLFILPNLRLFRRFGAVTLGHNILCSAGIIKGEPGRTVLAHELSHVRQHDWLGPLYLPLHIIAILISMLLYCIKPVKSSTPVHAYNPLEQYFLCIPFKCLYDYSAPVLQQIAAIVERFNV